MQLKKKFYLREAVGLYTKGLDMGSALPQLLSVLHSNRAQAHIMLNNWRNALQDSQRAVQLDAHNLKVALHPFTPLARKGVLQGTASPGYVQLGDSNRQIAASERAFPPQYA